MLALELIEELVRIDSLWFEDDEVLGSETWTEKGAMDE